MRKKERAVDGMNKLWNNLGYNGGVFGFVINIFNVVFAINSIFDPKSKMQ